MVSCLYCVCIDMFGPSAGEELTFDYNFERYGDKPMRCFCGSKRCRKFIGGTQETTANIVELGDAEDVTNDPEPVLVKEEETDVLVQAMLDKEVGTIQRGWDTKLLARFVLKGSAGSSRLIKWHSQAGHSLHLSCLKQMCGTLFAFLQCVAAVWTCCTGPPMLFAADFIPQMLSGTVAPCRPACLMLHLAMFAGCSSCAVRRASTGRMLLMRQA